MGASTPTRHCGPNAKARFLRRGSRSSPRMEEEIDKQRRERRTQTVKHSPNRQVSSELPGGPRLSLIRPVWFSSEPKPGSNHLETAAAALPEPHKRRAHPLNGSRNPGKASRTAPNSQFTMMGRCSGTSRRHQTLWWFETTPQWSDDRLTTDSFAAQHLEFFPPAVYARHHLS